MVMFHGSQALRCQILAKTLDFKQVYCTVLTSQDVEQDPTFAANLSRHSDNPHLLLELALVIIRTSTVWQILVGDIVTRLKLVNSSL
jgi:hypothetical protein